jgi:diadenosine tetraphosphate (Ap4A) HIT family hydrolase
MTSDTLEAKATLAQMQRDLEIQKSKWPMVRRVADALAEALEENHFVEKIRIAQEGNSERH